MLASRSPRGSVDPGLRDLAATRLLTLSLVDRYARSRKFHASRTTPDLHIDVNRAHVPDDPALRRPGREVVAHGDGPALAGAHPGAPELGPPRHATAASVGPRGSGRRLLGQIVGSSIDRGLGTRRRQGLVRVVGDVIFDTRILQPAVNADSRI